MEHWVKSMRLNISPFMHNAVKWPNIFSRWLLSTFTPDRSSRSEVFCKTGVLKKFAKFTGKYLC